MWCLLAQLALAEPTIEDEPPPSAAAPAYDPEALAELQRVQGRARMLTSDGSDPDWTAYRPVDKKRARRDIDRDGVADWIDLCPEFAQPADRKGVAGGARGCPSNPPLTDDELVLLETILFEAVVAEREVLESGDGAVDVSGRTASIEDDRRGVWRIDHGHPIAALMRGDIAAFEARRAEVPLSAEAGWEGDEGEPAPPAEPPVAFASAPASAPAPEPTVAAPAPAPEPTVAAPAPEPLAPSWPSIDERLPSGRKAPADAAVVIGLEDYTHIADVPYARRDAEAFYDFLVYTRGVPQERIQLLTSGAREHIEAAVARAGSEAGPGGLVWVYFAGHGGAHPSTGERMLFGDDVRADALAFASRGVPVAAVERAAATGGGRPILLLDTCYAGTGRSGQTLLAGTRFAVPAYVAAPEVATGIQWNASGPDELSAPLDAVRHGAFTYFAVGALRGWADGELDGIRDGRVTGDEARAYVVRALRVAGQNLQRPVWLGPADLSLAEGVQETGPRW